MRESSLHAHFNVCGAVGHPPTRTTVPKCTRLKGSVEREGACACSSVRCAMCCLWRRELVFRVFRVHLPNINATTAGARIRGCVYERFMFWAQRWAKSCWKLQYCCIAHLCTNTPPLSSRPIFFTHTHTPVVRSHAHPLAEWGTLSLGWESNKIVGKRGL